MTFSVLDEIKRANAPALDGFSSLATGEVRVTVQQVGGQLYEGDAPIVSASVAIGDAALRPTITPRGNEVLPDNSFTIESSGQAGTIYYKIFAGQTGVPSTETVTPGENGWEQYTPGTAVHYPGNYTAVTVAAVSYVTGGLPSEMDVVTYTTANLITPAAPQLRMGDRQDVFSPGSTYTDGETFYFLFDKTQTGWQQTENEVYYTLNGRDPVPGSEGYRYDESAPPALDFGLSNQLVIKAVTYDPELGAMSEVATFTVQRRVTVGRPVASVGSGETVRNGEAITLELPESFVDMMSDNTRSSVEYSAGSDVFSRYDSYTRASNSDEPSRACATCWWTPARATPAACCRSSATRWTTARSRRRGAATSTRCARSGTATATARPSITSALQTPTRSPSPARRLLRHAARGRLCAGGRHQL